MMVDTHAHIVSDDRVRYPTHVQEYAKGYEKDSGISAEGMIKAMDEAGIDKTVAVQFMAVYRTDNNYVVDAARSHPDRLVSVAVVDAEQPNAADLLAYWVKERGASGVRLTGGTSTTPWPEDSRSFPVWDRARDLRIPICMLVQSTFIPHLRRLLDRYPDIPVALDHMGMPRFGDGPPYESLSPLLALAAYPNVYLKFSTVSIMAAAEGKSTPQEVFKLLIDRFGPQRLMWGSNFPRTSDYGLKGQVELARKSLSFLSGKDAGVVFSETALSLWPSLRGPARG